MARQKGLSQAGYESLVLLTLGTCAAATYYIAVRAEMPPVAAPFVALGAGAAFEYYRINRRPRRSKRHPSAFAQLTEIIDWRFEQGPDNSAIAKFKERPVSEFLFRDPSLLSAPVPESVLKSFIKAGVRREQKARQGQHYQLERTETIRLVRSITINTAWSREYFTKSHRPRLLHATYKDCVTILVVTGFMDWPTQGKAPRLINWQVGEWGLYDGVKEWWLWLQSNKPNPPSGNRLKKFLPFTN